MSVSASLIAFGVRYVFDPLVDDVVGALKDRMTDHSQALPKALAKANDRAWQAVGLALAGDGLFQRIKDVFRDADLRGVRDQIKKFLDNTPTGLEDTSAATRVKAAEEWHRLRKGKRLTCAGIYPSDLARRAAALERYSDPARLTMAAHRAVQDTAAEWEYACRAGTTSDYWNGNGKEALEQIGWFNGNSGNQTHTVGEKKTANPWGLFDIHGNVWEWCQDLYCELDTDNTIDPLYTENEDNDELDGGERVARGGAWGEVARDHLAACRTWGAPDVRDKFSGFRVCFCLD